MRKSCTKKMFVYGANLTKLGYKLMFLAFLGKVRPFWCSLLTDTDGTDNTMLGHSLSFRDNPRAPRTDCLVGRRGAFLSRVLLYIGRLLAMATRRLSYPTPQFARKKYFCQVGSSNSSCPPVPSPPFRVGGNDP